jgi:UDP-galactopyranose mutase
MSRFAAQRRVFYVEEPVQAEGEPHIRSSIKESGVEVVVPHVPSLDRKLFHASVSALLDRFFLERDIRSFGLWFYTPMALSWLGAVNPSVTVYDCMDELSGFRNAPAEITLRESELLRRADLVFTGGHRLYEAKRKLHTNVYPFPSSIDVMHFARARNKTAGDPIDQSHIPHPRLGFCGVIDERMNLQLIADIAEARPDWQIVMLGPVAKIDPSSLPAHKNIHYLGMKSYKELPEYFAGWDVAILPFAHNPATEFISPTKTPEYLAAGRAVVSTSIRDVVRPYGEAGLVHIADGSSEFVKAVEAALAEDAHARLQKVDALLSMTSWSRTWGRMAELMDDVVQQRSSSLSLAAAAAAGQRAW